MNSLRSIASNYTIPQILPQILPQPLSHSSTPYYYPTIGNYTFPKEPNYMTDSLDYDNAVFLRNEINSLRKILSQGGEEPTVPPPFSSPDVYKLYEIYDRYKMLLPELNDSSRAQLEREDLNGNTRLTGAILFGTKQAVKYYLDLGANPNTENKFGKTPLLHAIDLGDREIAELLIQYGADVRYVNKNYFTPLKYSTDFGDGKLNDLLLSHGAILNELSSDSGNKNKKRRKRKTTSRKILRRSTKTNKNKRV